MIQILLGTLRYLTWIKTWNPNIYVDLFVQYKFFSPLMAEKQIYKKGKLHHSRTNTTSTWKEIIRVQFLCTGFTSMIKREKEQGRYYTETA